jgi:hypothetical protein
MVLLAFFGLWESTLLVGAGAVSVPVVIHLLNRRRFRIVTWAAMRFLLAAQRQNTRRMRLEQLILLLVRCALVALIVFAMASVMPWAEAAWAYFWPDGIGRVASRHHRVHHVLVLDGSLSMSAQIDGRSAFEQARQLALQKVQSCPAGDGFSVMLLKDAPTWIVAEASQDARKVMREIEALRPGQGNAAVQPALNMIAAKVGEAAGRFPVQAVYFFTDVQRATWQGSAPADLQRGSTVGKERNPYEEIQKRARSIFVDVGRDEQPNLAVTDLVVTDEFLRDSLIPAGSRVRIAALVENFGTQARKNVRVELLVGKGREQNGDPEFAPRLVDHKLIDTLDAKDRIPVVFDDYRFPAAGTYSVQVRVEGNDVLDLDDTRGVVLTVKETVPILLVNGKPAADRYERATEYVRLALNPFRPGTEPKFAPLRPRVIGQSQFADLTDADVAGYDAIFWCDVGAIGPGELRRVETHLRRGGGLVVALGDRAAENFETYNRLLYKDDQGILPVRLVKKVQAPAEHQFYFEAEPDTYLEPPLRAFSDEKDKNALRNARLRQYVQVKFGVEGRARTALSFQPEVLDAAKVKLDETLPRNDPALIEWQPPLGRAQQAGAPRVKEGRPGQASARYRGKVVLFTSTFNMDWTSWPGSPSFGAMMQELARVAVSGRLRQQAAPVGTLLEEFLPGGAETEVLVHFPTASGQKPAKVRTQLVEDVNILRFADTEHLGVYRASADAGKDHLFAINVPTRAGEHGGVESDLARLDQTKLEELYPGWELQLVRDARLARLAEGPIGGEMQEERAPVGPLLANIALLLALALIFVEILLAWQFGHYTVVDGAMAPPATGLLWPLSVGLIAGLLLLAGGSVLIHALNTGDFLGFLPDVLRAGVERVLGVPPPPAGEGTHWDLEFQPFLHVLGSERWWAGLIGVGALVLIFFTYRAEAPTAPGIYKALLGALRLLLVLLMVWVLLPQLQLRFDRQGWPDLVLLIDSSRSMGEPDHYQEPAILDRARQLGELVRKQLQDRIPAKLRQIEAELAAKAGADKEDLDLLHERLHYWEKQHEAVGSTKWRPTRLQLVQALLAQPDSDWLQTLVQQRRMKVHIYQLDVNGRAIKLADAEGAAGEITELAPQLIERSRQALAQLEPDGRDSRLGTALRQVIDHYRGASLSAVVMLTDGVTTRDETIAQASEYAAQKGVPLFLVGIGDDHEIRDLKLHDLQVEDTVFVNDTVQFEARLTGQGYKDLTVPVVLRIKGKDGKEKEVGREMIKVDPHGKSVKVRLRHTPTEVGRKTYVIEVEPPRLDGADKPLPAGNLRLERAIDVVETKLIKVLFVEGQPRYEFRYLKFLLERDHLSGKEKKQRSIELKVVLLDADDEFAAQDRTALIDFPATLDELNQYDVIILGDCDPRHKKLGEQRLKNIAGFVRGEDEKGKKLSKSGGGLLLIAGAFHNPHNYKNTPLADVIPVEPLTDKVPPEPGARVERLRPELTPVGRMHPIFRFSADEAENLSLWQRLAPMYFYSKGYKLKPLAEVLAVHPVEKAIGKGTNPDGHHPLAVQQFVGSGRSMFFGFDETWRWRLREDEARYNHFWVQTIRYLSRGRSTRTDLRLDRQTAYRLGEPIKVTVRFPDTLPGQSDGPKPGPPSDVRVTIEYRAGDEKEGLKDPEVQTLQLAKVEGSWGTYEGALQRTREGKYRFRLITPDVSSTQPDGEKPNAEAIVELPPGELDRLRMNEQELRQAAEATQGVFYTLASADQMLEDVPAGYRVSLSAPVAPLRLWNHWLIFAVVMFLLTSEWLLRKRKHLL